MFQSDKPLWLRGLSLFHLPLPVILVWQVCCFPACFFFTRPEENINWAFGPGNQPPKKIPAWLYLLLLLIGAPVFIYLPTHLLLRAIMPNAA
jgi:hypothetical protein